MGENTNGLSAELAAKLAIEAIKNLSESVDIPATLTELGVKAEDIPTLAENALKDACGFTNPQQASFDEICQIYQAAL